MTDLDPVDLGDAADPADPASRVAGEVLRSRRYRWLAPELVTRLARDEVPKSRNPAEAVKRTKRRLHQVFGAYVLDLHPEAAVRDLSAAAPAGPAALRDACRSIMSRHASTRERLPVLDRFYGEIFAITGVPGRLLDLACGLGPLAVPWMGLPERAWYAACDVDRRMVDLLAGALNVFGVPHRVELRDVAASPPEDTADVALLLKSAPCLEQQAPGSARRLLASLRAKHVVVSFPTRSLGGASKGMVAHYRDQFQATVEGHEWQVSELRFPPELVYVVTKGAEPQMNADERR